MNARRRTRDGLSSMRSLSSHFHLRARFHLIVPTLLNPDDPECAWGVDVKRADPHESPVKGRPISGVLGPAVFCLSMGPERSAPRPAWMLGENAPAMSTGSIAREIA